MAAPVVAGHSHGAFTAAALTGAASARPDFAGLADPRFEAAVLVSPQGAVGPGSWHGFYYNSPADHSWLNVTVPVLTIAGTLDNGLGMMTFEYRLDGFEWSPGGNKHAVVLRGVDHGDLVGGAPAVTGQTTAVDVAFADAYARGDATALAALRDVAGCQATHPLASEVYQRATGAAAGSGALRGTNGRDLLSGLSADDVMTGLAGDDTLDGGAGYDTAAMGNAGFRGVATATSGNRLTIISAAGTDTLFNIEVVTFADGRLVFDVHDPAARVLRLYEAALDRLPDQGGLNHWIDAVQDGQPLAALASFFLRSPEFGARFGDVPDIGAFVDQLYANVLGRAGDVGGRQFWVELAE